MIGTEKNKKDLIAGDRIVCKGQIWAIVEEYYSSENLVHYFKIINETSGNGQIVTGTQIYGLDYVRLVGSEEEEQARIVKLAEKHKRGERNREMQAVRFKINIM
ncbi:hypothetical protein [uncultured Clostridium sp.]|uniref:hypothetical protein n=1 Tax=uncultured Clostridium sp. TaxID=59620 RepID=UPI0025CD653A|nr:hypothetical protein [uncultured Clostridium sp.]